MDITHIFITDAFAFGIYFSIKKEKIIAKKYLLRMQWAGGGVGGHLAINIVEHSYLPPQYV